ncbi:tRNA uridine(34) 5-carboxymethylaminomethyl modification radical SAM/GNAT enzyme Elp3 [Candidatus Bathyarchaeota archaeon A05DMB-2]|jgi:elongator complex protein 3|nr:tRNA uridine(34) 5-carboxymethylaminomethyl modification radical SAM/GNAT enzyme Elp3 [Candidatus Bathyarchaeota archaeon A05DMB-2]
MQAREVIEALMLLPSPTHEDVNRAKNQVAAKHQLSRIPSNAEIIAAMTPKEKRRLLSLLRRKTTRAISGVTVVAVMAKPQPCPQDEPCAYCPGGPKQGVPQSYTGHEPAAMRGAQNGYDPYLQVRSRSDQLTAIGHRVDKVELIVMGGTFPATPFEYQTWFIQRCLDAVTSRESASLEEAKANAETSRIRNVGITVETRPDWCKQPHVDAMLDMGVTRVELGVQNPDDAIYRLVGRTHKVADVAEATRIAKDAGLKVVYHMMPGMPGSNPEADLASFKRVFADSAFKPDMVKIYPCLVIAGTKAYEWYRKGVYKPYTTEEAVELITDVKKTLPPWVRVMRVQRDIPAGLIVAGVDKSNLRQLVQWKLAEQGERCRCIRCREVGHRMAADGVKPDLKNVQVLTARYEASEGEEVFISAEDPERDVLIGYLRLRVPSAKAHRAEIAAVPSAIVRELHVYGPLVPVGKRSARAWQHKGFGAVLLSEAERVARDEYGLRKLLVISALGTRQYYMRFDYRRDGVYVSKMLH